MSATFHLYKIRDDLQFIGTERDFASKEKVKEYEENICELSDEQVNKFYSYRFKTIDGNIFIPNDTDYIDIIDIYNTASGYKKCKGYKRQLSKLEIFSCNVLHTKRGYTYRAIPVEEVLYRQGWFLKKKWFRKRCTYYVATTKQQLISFFKLNLDVKRYDSERAIECMQTFIKYWEDGMIFVVSW